jgi:hypothetical protein
MQMLCWGYAPIEERAMMKHLLLQSHFLFGTIPPEYKENLSEAALQQEAMQPVQPTNRLLHAPCTYCNCVGSLLTMVMRQFFRPTTSQHHYQEYWFWRSL